MKQWYLVVVLYVGIFSSANAMIPAAGAAAAAAGPYVASAGAAIATSEAVRIIKERNADPQDGPITLRHY